MTTTAITHPADGPCRVTSTDPAVPDALLDDSERFAICPACDARLRLRWWDDTGESTGIEYQLHYINEHVLPAIRYEETGT
jgi:hypothetical protein